MNITTIGGGTGTYNVLVALKSLSNLKINAIVSMSDDGGSTGKLRDEYGVLPSGDIRRAVVALSNNEKNSILRELFNYRFKGGGLAGHSLGNLIMLALQELCDNNYGKSIDQLEELFDIKGKIYPVTFEKTRLLAKLQNGQYILGETNIDIPKHDGKLKIQKLSVIKDDYAKVIAKLSQEDIGLNIEILDKILEKFLEDLPVENPRIQDVLMNSDYIIVGPGDLHTSILPNILIGNVSKYLKQSKAKKILIMNLFTKFGETTGFKLSDFIKEFDDYLGADIFDYILVQDWQKYPIENDILQKYKQENKDIIQNDYDDNRIIKGDFVKQYDMARHDPDKIRVVLSGILKNVL